MADKTRTDPARDLLDIIGRHAQDSSRQVLPQLDTGTVILVNDPSDGTVVQLDNMSVAASDCNLLGSHLPTVGDRVLVIVHMEEFWIVSGIQGQSSGGSSGTPSGAAGGDLDGTYPNPTIEGSVALTGSPSAPTAAPGTNTTQLASTAFVTAAITAAVTAVSNSLQGPASIKMWAGPSIPTGWLACDGSSQLRATYPNLFAEIGTTFGSIDGTHFNLPDFRGRGPMGLGTGDATGATAWTLALKGGAETATISVAQLPAHDHSPTANNLTGSATVTGVTDSSGATTTGGSFVPLPNAGNGTAANPGTLFGGGSYTNTITSGVTGYDVATLGTTAHVHSVPNHSHSFTSAGSHTHTISSIGSNTAHANVHPALGINIIIKT